MEQKRKVGRPKGTPKTGGRSAGTPNKLTVAAKEAIQLAAEGLGGPDRLIAWAKEDPLNERAFWASIYPKLIPVQVTGEGGGPVGVRLVVQGIVPGTTGSVSVLENRA